MYEVPPCPSASRPAQIRSRLASGSTVALLVVALAASSVSAQGASPASTGGPDTPVSSSPLPSEPIDATADGATLAVPRDDLSDIRTQAWDHIDVASDGRTLTVYFWNGVDTCYGLAGVDVSTVDGVVTVIVRVGTLPYVDACIDLAQLYKTIVVLDAPVIAGGIPSMPRSSSDRSCG